MKKRILVCGGRDFNNQDLFNKAMEVASKWFAPRFCIIHGAARGADRMAMFWAFVRGCAMISMPANWDYYDRSAGSIRNGWMLEFGMPDLVIAFPGGKGTADMVKQARAAGIDVWEVK